MGGQAGSCTLLLAARPTGRRHWQRVEDCQLASQERAHRRGEAGGGISSTRTSTRSSTRSIRSCSSISSSSPTRCQQRRLTWPQSLGKCEGRQRCWTGRLCMHQGKACEAVVPDAVVRWHDPCHGLSRLELTAQGSGGSGRPRRGGASAATAAAAALAGGRGSRVVRRVEEGLHRSRYVG